VRPAGPSRHTRAATALPTVNLELPIAKTSRDTCRATSFLCLRPARSITAMHSRTGPHEACGSVLVGDWQRSATWTGPSPR